MFINNYYVFKYKGLVSHIPTQIDIPNNIKKLPLLSRYMLYGTYFDYSFEYGYFLFYEIKFLFDC